ncbi:hypothetical protein CRG98_011500 [Punica granatum]|uniref:Uncharacterized protein n=1 Tax=Punica granatum TaxID=22663 RepID=A0A2I0KHD3_PUNGR|nr:hypothetical protein CRG98_011500 [Punica granatum]
MQRGFMRAGGRVRPNQQVPGGLNSPRDIHGIGRAPGLLSDHVLRVSTQVILHLDTIPAAHSVASGSFATAFACSFLPVPMCCAAAAYWRAAAGQCSGGLGARRWAHHASEQPLSPEVFLLISNKNGEWKLTRLSPFIYMSFEFATTMTFPTSGSAVDE